VASAAGGSVVLTALASALSGALKQARMHGASIFLTTGLQALYLTGPTATVALIVSTLRAWSTPSTRMRTRCTLLASLLSLATLTVTPLPRKAPLRLLRFLSSGLASGLRDYHSFQVIEEVPLASLPSNRGRLLACVPHGIVPYGVMLLWLEVLRQGRLLGGLGASVLFRLPLLRQFLGAIGIEPATPRALAAKLRVPGSDTFLVPGGIAEMFLNDPDLEVAQALSLCSCLARPLRRSFLALALCAAPAPPHRRHWSPAQRAHAACAVAHTGADRCVARSVLF